MEDGIKKFTGNEYFKSLIPPNIVITLELSVAYITGARELIFVGGKLKSLSLLNIVTWWKFIKMSRKFIMNVVETWK